MNKSPVTSKDQDDFIPIGQQSKIKFPPQLNLAAHFFLHGCKDIGYRIKVKFRGHKEL